MKNKLLVNKIRQELIQTIRQAVEKEAGCIGTFYKNKGCRYYLSQEEEEYDDSPIVVAHIPNISAYGGFIAATVFDLYIDTESLLMCTLNGESGEDWDEPIAHVQVEGLACIVEWLQKNGFIQVQSDNPYRCASCGSTNVQLKAWVSANNNEYIESIGSDGDEGDNWCEGCGDHTELILESELLKEIDEWWEEDLGMYSKEKISGLWMFDYDMSGDCKEFLDDCNKKWNEFTKEEKIEKWANNKNQGK
ncbi:MAG: hypothetical protein EZS26_000997 [Candidatus Ordinivivax streblomastigis]|uniref:Uncharacterized protein n=1 Tax=Candidatus Ordinivivax streblomastigis TaxID=2540710 RepID=A0A5M8P2W8_9BACT|nr:MAG: hypothetical protein EZS26_000997 [Candidatus Ordinivivax streblomastigis]